MNEVKVIINDIANNVLGAFEVFTHADFPLTVNYIIADINNISKRSGAFTKTFRIPANKTNNALVNSVYNVNVHQNMTEWFSAKPCTITVNGLPVLKGELTLKQVYTKTHTREYECVIKGSNIEWVKLLAEKYIHEFDFGLVTNPSAPIQYTKAHIETNWASNFGIYDYVFPVIHYGEWVSTQGVVVEDLKPALYIVNIINKMFDSIGWKFTSAFMGTPDFKKLVLPFLGDNFSLPESYVTDRQCKFRRDTFPPWGQKFYNTGAGAGDQLMVMTNLMVNPLGQLQNFGFKPDKSGWYRLHGQLTFGWSLPAPSGGSNFQFRIGLKSIGATSFTWFSQFGYKASGQYLIDSGYVYLNSAETYQLFYKGMSALWEQPTVSLLPDLVAPIVDSTLTWTPSTKIGEGSEFEIKDVLSKGINCLKLLQGLIHAFNLYLTTDIISKVVYIEPRPDFFDTIASANDWSNKLDRINDIELKFISDYERNYCLQYLEDTNDKHLEERNLLMGNTAGAYCYTFSDRFKNENKIDENPFFSYTYHILDESIIAPQIGLTPTKYDAPIVARLWQEYKSDNDAPQVSWKFEPRLLYYDYSTQVNPDTTVAKTWLWYGAQEVSIPTALSQGFNELPTNTNLAYNSWNDVLPAQAGNFENYYDDEFIVIEKGTLLMCYLALTDKDIAEIDFRKLIYFSAPFDIKGYWILNKIIDYAPTVSKLTKVELLRYEENVPAGIIYEDNMVRLGKEYNWFGDVNKNLKGLDGEDNWESVGINKGKRNINPVTNPSTFGDWNTFEIGGGGTSAGDKTIAPWGMGNIVIGQGLIGMGKFQTVLGTYNIESESDVFQIGGGISDTTRNNLISINEDGNFKIRGGELVAEVNGEITFVLAEIDGIYQKVYI